MCKAKSYAEQLLNIYKDIDADINSLCKEEKMANLFDLDMLHVLENTNFNACDGYKLAKQIRDNRLFRRHVKNELDTLLRLKANIIDTNHDLLNRIHQEIILRDNYLNRLVENKTYTPKVIGVKNPEIKFNKPDLSKFAKSTITTPISVPSTPEPMPLQQDSIPKSTVSLSEVPQMNFDTVGNAIHKKTKEEMQVINKVDEGHYLVKRKGGLIQVLCKKYVINLECSQVAK